LGRQTHTEAHGQLSSKLKENKFTAEIAEAAEKRLKLKEN